MAGPVHGGVAGRRRRRAEMGAISPPSARRRRAFPHVPAASSPTSPADVSDGLDVGRGGKLDCALGAGTHPCPPAEELRAPVRTVVGWRRSGAAAEARQAGEPWGSHGGASGHSSDVRRTGESPAQCVRWQRQRRARTRGGVCGPMPHGPVAASSNLYVNRKSPQGYRAPPRMPLQQNLW